MKRGRRLSRPPGRGSLGSLGRLVLRLLPSIAGVGLARRRAVTAFRRELRAMGLPSAAIAGLARVYPKIALRK